MFTYSTEGLALMLLNVVVWDRSDIVILHAIYHSPATSPVRSLRWPSIWPTESSDSDLFQHSMAATMMAQYGRGKPVSAEMTVDSGRYALFLALPCWWGWHASARWCRWSTAGSKNAPMISTLSMVALFAISKAMVAAPTMLPAGHREAGFPDRVGVSLAER